MSRTLAYFFRCLRRLIGRRCYSKACSHTCISRVLRPVRFVHVGFYIDHLCPESCCPATAATAAVAAHCSFEPQQWQRTAHLNRSSNTQPTLDLTLAFRSHNNSFCNIIRTLNSRLYIRTTWVSQTPPKHTVRFFEIRSSSFTVLMIPLSFAHHIPVDHHKIPHLVHHAYSLA